MFLWHVLKYNWNKTYKHKLRATKLRINRKLRTPYWNPYSRLKWLNFFMQEFNQDTQDAHNIDMRMIRFHFKPKTFKKLVDHSNRYTNTYLYYKRRRIAFRYPPTWIDRRAILPNTRDNIGIISDWLRHLKPVGLSNVSYNLIKRTRLLDSFRQFSKTYRWPKTRLSYLSKENKKHLIYIGPFRRTSWIWRFRRRWDIHRCTIFLAKHFGTKALKLFGIKMAYVRNLNTPFFTRRKLTRKNNLYFGKHKIAVYFKDTYTHRLSQWYFYKWYKFIEKWIPKKRPWRIFKRLRWEWKYMVRPSWWIYTDSIIQPFTLTTFTSDYLIIPELKKNFIKRHIRRWWLSRIQLKPWFSWLHYKRAQFMYYYYKWVIDNYRSFPHFLFLAPIIDRRRYWHYRYFLYLRAHKSLKSGSLGVIWNKQHIALLLIAACWGWCYFNF